jgi:5-methyltetrahydrofolate--homocysteine methyltransferase
MLEANTLKELAKKRVLILDGAMGTAIQQCGLVPEDFTYPGLPPAIRSFSEGWTPVPGCNEVLSLSRPDVISDIHKAYIEAGADIIETNTFGANRFGLKDYGLSDKVYELNLASAKLAREAAKSADKAVFVAGDIGPTGRSASFSPSVDDPSFRESDFHDFVDMYREQLKGLLDGGVDIILIETIFDTLVAKAALTAVMKEFKDRQIELPIMVSATFSDKSRRTLSGQSLEAFISSLSSYPIFSLGVNCSTGASEMVPLIHDLAKLSPFRTSAHPNAGFPDNDGFYTQTPGELTELLRPVLEEGLLSIVGGCCGTRPEHIAAIAKAAKNKAPFQLHTKEPVLKLSAWDVLSIPMEHQFITVGERANVAGSRKFARLIKEEKFEEAILLIRKQIEAGAQIIDVCMDDPLIDAPEAMKKFLRLVAADPVAARVPVMIDSSSWSVIEAALPELQGRGIVNSISLKEGEEEFLQRANTIHDMGAALMVMLFDEHGQADTFARKCSVAERAYSLLMEKTQIKPESIIFDPNILSIATGIDEHDLYARDFIRAIAWIKEHFPKVKISGGLSNLSFAFRGNNPLRKAMHTIFLELAVEAGLDMAIVNPAMEFASAGIPEQAKAIIKEALLLEKGDGPAARQALIDLAMSGTLINPTPQTPEANIEDWRIKSVEERLSEALIRGDDSHLVDDLNEAGKEHAMELIEGPLMGGMSKVGELFGEGKVFLPQIVRSARIMKKAVDILRPYLSEMDNSTANTRGTVVLATVKGDVHDIGKNIVSLVLQCNHFQVIDLGVMVRPEKIFQAVIEHKADMLGLSGLITPSLTEMATVCSQFEKAGLTIPIMIGGATTSEAHTATRLAPHYPGRVVYSSDASHSVSLALKLASKSADDFLKKTQQHYKKLSEKVENKKRTLLSPEKARKIKHKKTNASPKPENYGVRVVKNIPLTDIIPLINWKMLALAWQVKPNSDEAKRIKQDAKSLLHDEYSRVVFENALSAMVGFFPAYSQNEDVYIDSQPQTPDSRLPSEASAKDGPQTPVLHFLRQQEANKNNKALSLADYVSASDDSIGLFVVSAGKGINALSGKFHEDDDEYRALLVSMLADRLVEALSEYLHQRLNTEWWKTGQTIIRPANGYPSAPDHSEKKTIFNLLEAEKHLGVKLTESFAMDPVSSVCGYYFADKDAHYFSLGMISDEQFEKYAERKGKDIEELKKVFAGKISME